MPNRHSSLLAAVSVVDLKRFLPAWANSQSEPGHARVPHINLTLTGFHEANETIRQIPSHGSSFCSGGFLGSRQVAQGVTLGETR
jgi:hypothetical protein